MTYEQVEWLLELVALRGQVDAQIPTIARTTWERIAELEEQLRNSVED